MNYLPLNFIGAVHNRVPHTHLCYSICFDRGYSYTYKQLNSLGFLLPFVQYDAMVRISDIRVALDTIGDRKEETYLVTPTDTLSLRCISFLFPELSPTVYNYTCEAIVRGYPYSTIFTECVDLGYYLPFDQYVLFKEVIDEQIRIDLKQLEEK